MLSALISQYFSHIVVFLAGFFIGMCGEAWARRDWYQKLKERDNDKKD